MREKTDVLIIGGGVIGVCSAYYLQRAGREVTLVEAGEVCAGSSYGNAGLVVPSHSIPLAEPGAVMKGLKWMFKADSPFYIKPRLSWDLLAWLWRFWRASSRRRVDKAVPVLRDMGLASRSLYDQIAAEHDFEGLGSVSQVRRIVEIAVLDTLALENSVARSRTLAYLAQVALKTLEVGEFEERVAELERALQPRLQAAGGRR